MELERDRKGGGGDPSPQTPRGGGYGDTVIRVNSSPLSTGGGGGGGGGERERFIDNQEVTEGR